ncbi:MAG: leucine-rich repeat domain-containing protein, partial [Paludibacteraceae bacterium]|nr:leucine-rich repeat domain-containing protein [Paludibacteraceae bacterium]
MKKLFTLIVAICATTLAWADASGKCGSNVTYSYVSSTGTLTISGTGDMKDYDSSNVPWSTYSSDIKKVVIENGVTSIGYAAFRDCTGLTSITIPNSVTSIGEDAFDGCTGLTSINVAEDNLNYASIDGVLYSKDKKTLIICPPGKTGSVTIPNSVTSIRRGAFYDCTGLTSVTIPNSVTSIGNAAFEDCTGLTSVTIGNGVTSIGDFAFYGCTGLTNITIPNSVTSIGEYAFRGCTGLTSVTIGNGVTSIGDFAFCKCSKLTSVEIPNSVTSIGREAFYGCTGLTSITIGNDVTSIGYQAFRGCTGLTSITIPNSVTSIGDSAFEGCTGLTSMTVEATNPPLCVNEYGYANGFLDMPDYNIPLYVPAGSVNAYERAEDWENFTNIQAIPATGVNEATVENTVEKSEVKKIIDRNGIIYIEKDGTRYFLNG